MLDKELQLAKVLDEELGFINGDGPTLQKLQRYPPVIDLCFCAYGECSDGVKSLLEQMAQARLKSQSFRSGSLEAAKELSQVTGYLRRRLSTATVKANVKCPLERLVVVEEGREQADKR